MKVFDENKMALLAEAKLDGLVIGKLKLDEDKLSIMRLNPKFAVLDKLKDEIIENEIEVALAKLRYEITKLEELKTLEEAELERPNGKKVKLDESAVDESDEETDYELAEAKERQILTRLVKRLTILSGEQQIAKKIHKCICLN